MVIDAKVGASRARGNRDGGRFSHRPSISKSIEFCAKPKTQLVEPHRPGRLAVHLFFQSTAFIARFVMSNVERTPAGLQIVMPGCERRTLPKSTTRSDAQAQGLFSFYRPPSQREMLAHRVETPLQARRAQKSLPRNGLITC